MNSFLFLITKDLNNALHYLSPRPQLYRCNLSWKDDTTLLIGWANNLKVSGINCNES